MKYKVLSTKKLEPSVIEYAKKNCIEIIEKEFISVKSIFSEENREKILELMKSGISCFIFTSSNAVSVLRQYKMSVSSGQKIFCLSGKTKNEILEFGFAEKNIVGEAENASDLAKKIIKQKIDEIIFFCGNKRRDELPSLLKKAGVKVHEIIVYETLETSTMINDMFDAVLFFSPSTVQSFFQKNKLNEQIILFAIGETTADEIKRFTSNKILIAGKPSEKNLLKEAISFFEQVHH